MDNKLNYTEENEEREDGKLSYRTPIYLQLREIIRVPSRNSNSV